MIKHYDKIYAFEANPALAKKLKTKFRIFPHVKIINAALHETHNKEIPFYISRNEGYSSSVLEVNENNQLANHIQTVEETLVKSVNLAVFLKENHIDYIHYYISDLQGMDFRILQTVKSYIHRKAIGKIQIETIKDGRQPIYKDSENYEANFYKLLNNNYMKTSHGWHSLKNGIFIDVDNNSDEYDVCWTLRNN